MISDSSPDSKDRVSKHVVLRGHGVTPEVRLGIASRLADTPNRYGLRRSERAPTGWSTSEWRGSTPHGVDMGRRERSRKRGLIGWWKAIAGERWKQAEEREN